MFNEEFKKNYMASQIMSFFNMEKLMIMSDIAEKSGNKGLGLFVVAAIAKILGADVGSIPDLDDLMNKINQAIDGDVHVMDEDSIKDMFNGATAGMKSSNVDTKTNSAMEEFLKHTKATKEDINSSEGERISDEELEKNEPELRETKVNKFKELGNLLSNFSKSKDNEEEDNQEPPEETPD